MNICSSDIDLAKSIFTALGYMTRATVADIKSKKRVQELEKDFLKIRSNFQRFEEICKEYSLLKSVDSFSPGIEACLMQIINFLNTSGTCDDATLERLTNEAKKVNSVGIKLNLKIYLISYFYYFIRSVRK